MPRGRPIKKTDAVASSPGGGTHPSPPGVVETAGIDIPLIDIPGLPPSKVKGEWNPDYFASLLDMANRRYMQTVLLEGQASQFNLAQFQKGVIDAARMVGITEREILDRRSPEQRAEDVWTRIFADPESAFAIQDEDLRSLDALIEKKEAAMDAADRLAIEEHEKILSERDTTYNAGAARAAPANEARLAENRSPKAWRRRIQRILRLRARASCKVPKNMAETPWTSGNQYTRKGLIPSAIESAHPMRFMVYVGRAGFDLDSKPADHARENPEDLIFDVSEHHMRFWVHLWIHRNGCAPVRDKESGKHYFEKGRIKYQGSLQVMPVGHGKTDAVIHYAGLEMALNPRTQAYYIHAKSERAKKGIQGIKRFLNKEDPTGQRYLSLFPMELDAVDNDATHIRVKVKNTPKSPTFTGVGVDSSELGGDSNFQIWDDIVPQEDVVEESTRKQRWDKMRGTYFSRQRIKGAFTLVIGTFWHRGDALMQILDKARTAAETGGTKGIMFGVLVQRVGGPQPTSTTKAWQPLWPKVKGVAELKQEYEKYGPSLYSAAMMSNPIADEQRIVKKIRFYDPLSPEHESFMASSLKYISLDPAATNSRGSDKAGVVYAGVGDVRIHNTDADGNRTTGTERRVRFLDCHEIHATQSELTEYTTSFAATKQVDYVIVEAVSGFRGIVEMFEGRGIDAIRVNPRGKNKEQRLRAVAPFIEDASANLGIRAIAEFPGVWEGEGEKRRLVADPRFRTVIEQILDFGVCAGDHIVDAVTYLLGYVSSDLSIGRGIVTDKVRFMKPVLDEQRQRLLSMYEAYERADKLRRSGGGTSEEAEDKWMRQDFQ
jgi:hypothetical protein